MYGVDLDAPPSITPDSIVTVPNVQVDNEETYLTALQHIDPLSPDHDDDYGINCYITVIESLNGIVTEINNDH